MNEILINILEDMGFFVLDQEQVLISGIISVIQYNLWILL